VIVCKRNSDFLLEARAKVLEQVKDNEDVSFCFYRHGQAGRCVFTIPELYWQETSPTSCIYYWIGPKPKSPVEKMNKMEGQLGETRNELRETRARASHSSS
jgi:hypothetical protein